MPLFATGRLVVNTLLAPFTYGARAPAATFDSPRYASRYGIRRDGAEPADGVAVTAPLAVRTEPGPPTNVSLLGTPAKKDAGSDSVAVTDAESPVVPVGASVTLGCESVSPGASRLYVTAEEP